MAVYKPSNADTAVVNAQQLQVNNPDYDIAMWAACKLMAFHGDKTDLMQEYALMWASRLKSEGRQKK